MQFTVPQFVEREPRIVGPFTFKQFIFIGIGIAFSILFYFTLPFFLFLPLATIFLGMGFLLAVFKIKKIPLPIIIKNFFIFLFKPKIYLWKKKNFTSNTIWTKELKKKSELNETYNKPVIGLGKRGEIGKLQQKIEIKK